MPGACPPPAAHISASLMITLMKPFHEPPLSFGRQTGSLKYLHHFGLNRFATLGEQLIVQEAVTHSIKPLLPLELVLGAAAFAAGDRLGGTTCFGSQNPPWPLTVARHCSMVTKPQFVPPPLLSTAHHL